MDDQTGLGIPDESGGLLTGDANADGIADYVTITSPDGTTLSAFDHDQSGLFEEVRIDVDGDMVADITAFDTTGDGQFDLVQQVDPVTGQLVAAPLDGVTGDPTQAPVAWPATQDPAPSAPGTPAWYDEQGLAQPGWEVADPVPAADPGPAADPVPGLAPEPEPDLVHGDGDRETAYAQDQAFPGYCGPASIAIILTELLGRPIDDVAVANDVNNAGLLIFNESGAVVGMTDRAIVTMLDAYGVDAHSEQGDVDDLREYLDEGREIILAVDSSEVWGWQEDGLDISDNPDAATADRSDHFLVITEINDATGMVTLNDPGIGEAYGFEAGTGHGYQVPIALLEDAWADSGNVMIVTDEVSASAAGSLAAGSSEPAPGDGAAPSMLAAAPAGLVLLPATVGRRLVRALRERGYLGG